MFDKKVIYQGIDISKYIVSVHSVTGGYIIIYNFVNDGFVMHACYLNLYEKCVSCTFE